MPAKKTYLRRYLTGLTLIEAMVTILVLGVIVIGAAGFRYYSALDARKAVKEADAARIALMFLESWRGRQGNPSFDPKTQLYNPTGFITGPSGSFPPVPTDITWTPLGSYTVTMKPVNPSEPALTYYVTLSYNTTEKPGIRILNAIVAWPISMIEKNYTASGNYCTITLTTYTENIF